MTLHLSRRGFLAGTGALALHGLFDAANAALFFGAVQRGPVAVAVLTHYLAPLLIALAAPWLLRERRSTRALLGATAEVVDPIAAGSGTVRISGALWSARSLHDDDLAAGTSVVVVEISGATAVVTAADPGKG